MPTNNFLPFGVAAGANSWSDAAYNGSSQQQTGIQKGIVPSGLMTKAWRQATVPASALGQIIVDHGLIDANDDGNVLGFKANLRMAMAAMLAGAAFGVDQSSTPNVLTVNLDPTPPSLSTYRGILVRVANTNTGPVTLALNALGTKGVVRRSGETLQAADLKAGQFIHLIYDLAAGQWVVSGSVDSDTKNVVLNVQRTQIVADRGAAAQVIPTSVLTRLTNYGSVTLASQGGSTFSNGVLTIGLQDAGLWFLSCAVKQTFNGTTNPGFAVYIVYNGAGIVVSGGNGLSGTVANIVVHGNGARLMNLNVGDTIEVKIIQTTTGPFTFDELYSFSALRLGSS